jgi:serine/threonine kinase PknH
MTCRTAGKPRGTGSLIRERLRPVFVICLITKSELGAIDMRRMTAVLALASGCILVAACSNSTSTPTATGKAGGGSTTTTSATPVAAGDLPGLLLSEAEINAALGTTGMAVVPPPEDRMNNTSSGIANKDCVFMANPVETSVYTGSGYLALHGQKLQDVPDISTAKYMVDEAVVSFPSATNAADFFTASSQRWPACSNQKWVYQGQAGANSTWTVGPFSNKNRTLRITNAQEGQGGWACQRALTVANNVAVDVNSCSYNPDDSGVKIAQQIAAKVPK